MRLTGSILSILLFFVAPYEFALGQAAGAALKNPAALTEKAPDTYRAKFDTTKGAFVIEVNRAWAPLGADRFYNLVKNGYYDNCRFFRVIDGFMAQFGISGDPSLNTLWRQARIQDDPVKQSNKRGWVSFATSGPNSRTTQVFVNYADQNSQLDGMGFAPFGRVVQGMNVVDSLYSGYGEGAPRGKGPEQFKAQTEGNTYLQKEFPKLDYVKSAVIVEK
jgi:peptidyl-prolyl cis-trans isomerase A (cyclophilin A)